MDNDEFNRRVARLGTTSKAVEGCREVLVNGATYMDAALKYRLQPSLIFRVTKRIRDTEFCSCCGQAIK